MTATTTRDLVRGSLAGLGATGAMSATMWAARRAGWMGKLPPERITEFVLRAVGIRTSERSENALSTLGHLGYGAASGALFALVRRRSPRPLPGVAAGAGFGLAVWAVSYAGWIPALGILPPPQRDRRRRPSAMVAAHLVYGAVLGLLAR